MSSDLASILNLEVPVLVVLGERKMRVSDVVSLVPGAIIELPKEADEELELRVNNKPVGTGLAVKVGENFGLRVSYMGDLQARIEAMGADEASGNDDMSGGAGTAPASVDDEQVEVDFDAA